MKQEHKETAFLISNITSQHADTEEWLQDYFREKTRFIFLFKKKSNYQTSTITIHSHHWHYLIYRTYTHNSILQPVTSADVIVVI